MTPNKPLRALARAATVFVALRAAFRRRATARPGPPPPAPESDVDASEREVPANRRAETLAAALLLLGAVFGFGFTAVYIVRGNDTQLLGIALGGALAMLAAAAIVAGKLIVPQETA